MKHKLDEMIGRCLQNGDFAGANATVYQKGRCLYNHSFGMADIENGIPMAEDTIFRIYSLTKPVTAVAVMQLIEAGKLHPEFPVGWFIPEFSGARVYEADGTVRPAARDIRVQDLLTMTSGLAYPNCNNPTQNDTASLFGEMDAARLTETPMDTLTVCRRLGQIPLQFDPGTEWDYGTSADVLGGLVEVVTGRNYRDYLIEHIFEPLGMTDTDFFVPPEKLGRFAASYERQEDGTLKRDDAPPLGLNGQRSLPAFISGGAGLTSTIRDYAKFANMLANGGTSYEGVRILNRRSVSYMATSQIAPLNGYGYGCLVRVLADRTAAGTLATLGEFGWDGWTGTYFCVDPAEELCILFWIQLSYASTSIPAKLMRNIVYSSLE